MAAKYTDTITTDAGTVLAGATVELLTGAGALVTTYTDDALTQNPATSRTADANGLVELYVADGTYSVRITSNSIVKTLANVELYDLSTLRADASASTADKANASALGVANTATDMGAFTGITIADNVSAKVGMQSLETAVETKANATAVGVTSSAANMGTYTGTTIPDNETAKQNIQSLETAVETKANASAVGVTASAANMGTYTGSTITDNQTAKQNIQELETAAELRLPRFADRTALAAVSTTLAAVYDAAYLWESGREGTFVWSTANNATNVTNDPGQGVYVPPTSDTTGASGAWVRKFDGAASVKWYGATGDAATDDTTAISRAITQVGTGGALFFPEGVYIFSTVLTQLSGQKWFGAGRDVSILRLKSSVTTISICVTAADFAEDYSIEDMQIDGNRGNITPGSGDLYNTFYLVRGARGAKRVAYKNLILSNSWGRVLQTSNESVSEYAEDILVDSVWVTNAGTKAISATQSKRVSITNCFVEVNPYTSAQNPAGTNADSASCYECNDSNDVVISGNHGTQIGSVEAPGIRLVNSVHSVKVFGNIIDGAEYLGFLQNCNDVEFFSNIGRDITGNAILIADTTGEAGTCKRVRVHHNTIIDPDDAFILIKADKTTPDPDLECYIYDNDFIQVSGTPTYGIYNFGVVAPATGGTCVVHAWNNTFTGTIPNHYAGAAAAEIRTEPEGYWRILGQSSVAVSHTGDTNETTLASVTVPANRMGKNGRLRVSAHWTYTNSANNKTPRIRFGGTQAAGTTETTTVQRKTQIEIGNRNSLSSQIVSATANTTYTGFGATSTAATTMTVATSSNAAVAITGQLANTGETITLESYLVEIYYEV